MRLSLLFVAYFSVTNSYKILIYNPLFGHSHSTFLSQIADTLTAAGHDVTMLVSILDEELVGKKNVTLTKDVITLPVEPEVSVLYSYLRVIAYSQLWEVTPKLSHLMDFTKNYTLAVQHTCRHVLAQENLIENLRARKYDVAISEPFMLCGFGLFEHLGIPGRIGAISATHLDIISEYMGEPSAHSYVPSHGIIDGEKMSLFVRLKNLLFVYLGNDFFTKLYTVEHEEMVKRFGANVPPVSELIAKNSFIFTNSNPYLDYPRPVIHKTVPIGGISVNLENIEKLDEKWNKFLDEKKHNVFISFGSVAKSKDMPEAWKQSILALCKALPDVNFIWKYEETTTIADGISNLYLFSWLPQKSLLSDKRLSLFVTHGGLGSTLELAYLGKPSLMIPLFAEQGRNSAMMKRHGVAEIYDKFQLGDPEELKRAIVKMLKDESYANNSEKLAKMLREQPASPKNVLVSHVEFVAKLVKKRPRKELLRFGSLPILDPFGRHLSFVQYYFLDVFALVFCTFIITILLVIYCIRCSCRKILQRCFKKNKTE